MARPTLTFACELGGERLDTLLADGSVASAVANLGGRVALALAELGPAQAAAVRRLETAGVPVLAVPLLSESDGYYLTSGRPDLAVARCAEWERWASREHLHFAGLALDIEPDIRIFEQIAGAPWSLPRRLLPSLLDGGRPARAAGAYQALVDGLRDRGWRVENYQFPLVADERGAHSTALQRIAGLVDVASDREVWMLYSSFLRGLGPGFIWAYGPEAAAIAVGSTGGGPDIPGHPQVPALTWDELARDLRLAFRWTDQIHVHSLEGCVEHGFLDRIAAFEWSPGSRPRQAGSAALLRSLLRGGLWTAAHSRQLAAGAALGGAAVWGVRRRRRSAA